MREPDRRELQQLLVRCWMTHDGAWFMSCANEFGMDAANRMNKAAIRTLAPIEVRRVMKACGVKYEGTDGFAEVRDMLDVAFQVIKGDFMEFTFDYPEENAFHWDMKRCFALEGMKMIGGYEEYECGVLYRVFCWLDSLGLDYTVEPPVEGCLMRETGKCAGTVRFTF